MRLLKTQYASYGFKLVFIAAVTVITFESLIAPIHSATPSTHDKLVHFGAYFILSLLAFLAYPKVKLWILGLGLLVLGGGLEIAQELMKQGRDGSIADQLANGGGVVLGLILVKIFMAFFNRSKP